ncbi:MAG: hypothetical protein ACD_3C00084G0004 [uncultured bacterium (gcode 4)]|uniref:Uncharacterized protein n=1 Tax=uncultured bacterium (gcode 4) TaxID=1234023 RepID=K2FZ62_9BACT|nr:MAG: hypothetical protein ACD_3C00084G0004 [uncultured bacterium (gcode 4)]
MKTLNLKKIIWILIVALIAFPIPSFAEFWKLSQRDREKVDRKIESISAINRQNYIEIVIVRVNSLMAAIRISAADESTKFRKVSILEDLRSILMAKLQNLTSTGANVPVISNLATTNMQGWFSLSSNMAWKWYYVILPSGSGAPTSAQIRSWFDNAWNTASVRWNFNLMSWVNNFNATWLSPGSNYTLYFVAEDSNGNISPTPQAMNFSTSSTSSNPPVFSTSLSWLSGTWGILTVVSNASWRWYFVILPSWSWMPTSAQIRTGRDSSWVSAIWTWSFNLVSWTNTFNLAGLTPNTNYVLYFAAEDPFWNLNLSPSTQSFTTSLTSDTIPPVVAASINFVTRNSATINMTNSEGWKWYYVALPSGSSAPTAAQIKAWTDSGWNMVSLRWSFNTTSWVNAFNVTWLNQYTSYVLYIVAEDAVWNLLQTPQVIPFTTLQQ